MSEIKKTIILKETMWKSIISDIFTYGLPFVFLYLSETYVGSTFLNAVIIFMLFIAALGGAFSKVNKHHNKKSAIKEIEEFYKD
jgi:hypothetical protein